jgi:hypothetical protein
MIDYFHSVLRLMSVFENIYLNGYDNSFVKLILRE